MKRGTERNKNVPKRVLQGQNGSFSKDIIHPKCVRPNKDKNMDIEPFRGNVKICIFHDARKISDVKKASQINPNCSH